MTDPKLNCANVPKHLLSKHLVFAASLGLTGDLSKRSLCALGLSWRVQAKSAQLKVVKQNLPVTRKGKVSKVFVANLLSTAAARLHITANLLVSWWCRIWRVMSLIICKNHWKVGIVNSLRTSNAIFDGPAVTGECSVPHRYPGMMKIHEDPRQQNRLNLAGPMCRDTCTSNSDDGFSSPWGRSWSCCTVWLRAAPQEWVVPLLGVQNDFIPWQHYKMGCHWVYKTILVHESTTKWVA